MASAFDATAGFRQDPAEILSFLRHFFPGGELRGKDVLDAGCRNGDYASVLLAEGAASVAGVDLSAACVAAARKRHRDEPRARFVEGSITDLKEFPDSSVDAVLCVGTIVYLEPPAMVRAMAEFLRVTRPGGVILVLFQKEKGALWHGLRWLAGLPPLALYTLLARLGALPARPLLSFLRGRPVSSGCAEYLLGSVRGVRFGVPLDFPPQARAETPTCEHCSEAATASFKIRVPSPKAVPWRPRPDAKMPK